MIEQCTDIAVRHEVDAWTETHEAYLLAGVPTIHGYEAAIDLARRFWDSDEGTYMDAHQPLRFSQAYGYDRVHMVTDLGPNTMHEGHAFLTTSHVIRLLERERELTGGFPFAADQVGLLVFMSLIHDSSETMHPCIEDLVGRVVGDIESGKKTDLDRRVEKLVRAAHYRKHYPDLDESTLWTLENLITHRDTTARHEVFEAAHCITEHEVVVNARRSVERARHEQASRLVVVHATAPEQLPFVTPLLPSRSKGEIRTMERLIQQVGTNYLEPKLRAMAGQFAYVKEYADQFALVA